MRNTFKKPKYLLLLLLSVLIFASCSHENKEYGEIPQTPDDDIEAVVPEVDEIPPQSEPEENIDPNLVPSLFTGLPIDKSKENMRPIAVMINNHKASLPQDAISFADVVFECNAEGGMTRLMAIIQDWQELSAIGSIRSARDYFIELAMYFDAIFVHAGGSPGAYYKIKNSDVDNIDGVNMYTLPSKTFYRDSDRLYKSGYEHSMMTSGEKLLKAIEGERYSTDLSETFVPPLSFSDTEFVLEGENANSISLIHSPYITVDFEYDATTNKYFKSSFGKPHKDALNDTQISFENILVLFVREKVLDEEGRIEVSLNDGGEGYYLCGGKCISIEWSIDNGTFSFYDGEKSLQLLQGKTHITFFNKNQKNKINIE